MHTLVAVVPMLTQPVEYFIGHLPGWTIEHQLCYEMILSLLCSIKQKASTVEPQHNNHFGTESVLKVRHTELFFPMGSCDSCLFMAIFRVHFTMYLQKANSVGNPIHHYGQSIASIQVCPNLLV